MGGHGQEPVLGCAKLRMPPGHPDGDGQWVLGYRSTDVGSNVGLGVICVRPKTARLDEMAQGLGADKKGSLGHSLAEGAEEARETAGRLQRGESGRPREESMSSRRRRDYLGLGWQVNRV